MKAIFHGGVLHGQEMELPRAMPIFRAPVVLDSYAVFDRDEDVPSRACMLDEYELDPERDAEGRLVYRWTRMV